MQGRVDSKRFGPWALNTGASSGIGREFARQIAASHINVDSQLRRIKSVGPCTGLRRIFYPELNG